jgi:hypothetical protein
MEWNALKDVNSGWTAKITFYSETSGGQNYTLYLNVVNILNGSVNYTSVEA